MKLKLKILADIYTHGNVHLVEPLSSLMKIFIVMSPTYINLKRVSPRN